MTKWPECNGEMSPNTVSIASSVTGLEGGGYLVSIVVNHAKSNTVDRDERVYDKVFDTESEAEQVLYLTLIDYGNWKYDKHFGVTEEDFYPR